jgi:hypothetical protein
MTRNVWTDYEAESGAALNGLLNAIGWESVVSGCTPTLGAGSWDVDIATGTVSSGPGVSETTDVPADTVTLATADPTDDRVSLITADTSTGAVSETAGATVASNPVAPDIPDGEVLICAVEVRGGTSSLSSTDLHDYRAVQAKPPETTGITDVTGSRTLGTWYQNTDGRPIVVYVNVDRSGSIDINDTMTDRDVVRLDSGFTGVAVIGQGDYYKVDTINNPAAVYTWWEQNL